MVGDLADRLMARGKIKLAKMRETMAVYALQLATAKPRATASPTIAVLAFDNLEPDEWLRLSRQSQANSAPFDGSSWRELTQLVPAHPKESQ